LSGRDGFGIFVEMKCIFSIMSEAENFSKSKEKEVGEETEAKGSHWCDRTLDRTRSRHDQCVRSVAAAMRGAGHKGLQPARPVPCRTGASGHAPKEQRESQS
jgi:hypothetical protein